jgi:hypothetical protein
VMITRNFCTFIGVHPDFFDLLQFRIRHRIKSSQPELRLIGRSGNPAS